MHRGGHGLEVDMGHIILSYDYTQRVNTLFTAIETEIAVNKRHDI